MTRIVEKKSGGPVADTREVPLAWEALEDAFENNAPEVHSYLHMETGEVIRIVDGIADPAMHARVMADPQYLRIDPVSSREHFGSATGIPRFVAIPQLGSSQIRSQDNEGQQEQPKIMAEARFHRIPFRMHGRLSLHESTPFRGAKGDKRARGPQTPCGSLRCRGLFDQQQIAYFASRLPISASIDSSSGN